MDLTFETLLVETPEPGIMVVTMNRPQSLNAMNTAMMRDLRALFTEVYVNPGLANCMVLTGAGERGFCPGADLKERAPTGGHFLDPIRAARWIALRIRL